MSAFALEHHHDGAVAVLSFDHGKANEMGTEQLDAIDALVEDLESGSTVALITLSRRTSRRGTPIFVAGANVTERVGWDDDRVKAHVRRQRATLERLRQAPVFHIAVVNGVALGWGTEYLLCCDWRIACDAASFGLPETGLGILPGAGGTAHLWAQVGVPQALRLGMTGERIDADEAYRIGLVQDRVADVDEGLARALEMAAGVAKRSPVAMRAFKRAVLAAVGRPPEDRLALEADAYEQCVNSGQAAIGRANFDRIRAGERPDWG